MKSTKTKARIAGILYLIIIASGLFSGLVARESLIVAGNATLTAQNIIDNEFLFRLGFIGDLIMTVADVGVALMFYILLKPVSKGLAMLAAFFRLTQASIMGLNMLNHLMALVVLSGDNYLASFSIDQLNSLATLFLQAHSYGYLISNIFFGFSCIVLSYLFFKSAYFPKFLAIMLALASFGYLANSYISFVLPQYVEVGEIIMLMTSVITEITLCLYLLIKGIKTQS